MRTAIPALLCVLAFPVAADDSKSKEIIDYQVKGSKAPEVRTTISPSGRVDTIQGPGRAADGSITGPRSARTHSVTNSEGQTVHHRALGNSVIVNEGHAPRGAGLGGGGAGGKPYKKATD